MRSARSWPKTCATHSGYRCILAEIIPFAAQLSLECLGNSDALYHNVEHTMLVTLAGHDIFRGRALVKDAAPAV